MPEARSALGQRVPCATRPPQYTEPWFPANPQNVRPGVPRSARRRGRTRAPPGSTTSNPCWMICQTCLAWPRCVFGGFPAKSLMRFCLRPPAAQEPKRLHQRTLGQARFFNCFEKTPKQDHIAPFNLHMQNHTTCVDNARQFAPLPGPGANPPQNGFLAFSHPHRVSEEAALLAPE